VASRLPNNIVRLAHAAIFAPIDNSVDVNMDDPVFVSSHATEGLTRFPPNVEQLTVERESTCIWLVARRNDVVLRFPLSEDDGRHLAALLTNLVS
jgi:hypothetical protein